MMMMMIMMMMMLMMMMMMTMLELTPLLVHLSVEEPLQSSLAPPLPGQAPRSAVLELTHRDVTLPGVSVGHAGVEALVVHRGPHVVVIVPDVPRGVDLPLSRHRVVPSGLQTDLLRPGLPLPADSVRTRPED